MVGFKIIHKLDKTDVWMSYELNSFVDSIQYYHIRICSITSYWAHKSIPFCVHMCMCMIQWTAKYKKWELFCVNMRWDVPNEVATLSTVNIKWTKKHCF